MNNYFAFSGPIGSGKSSVSKLVASRIGAGWIGFGATVKEIAVERRLPIHREGLQILGAELVANERGLFCRRVIDGAMKANKEVIVIDGLRHPKVLRELRTLVGSDSLLCVYIDAPQALRLERVKVRDGISAEKLAELEMHSTEAQVGIDIRRLADFVAGNCGSIEECVARIICWMDTRTKR